MKEKIEKIIKAIDCCETFSKAIRDCAECPYRPTEHGGCYMNGFNEYGLLEIRQVLREVLKDEL